MTHAFPKEIFLFAAKKRFEMQRHILTANFTVDNFVIYNRLDCTDGDNEIDSLEYSGG